MIDEFCILVLVHIEVRSQSLLFTEALPTEKQYCSILFANLSADLTVFSPGRSPVKGVIEYRSSSYKF